jgi:hypothetical protein
MRNLRELIEMYLSSQLLHNEVIEPLRGFMTDKEIRRQLSVKTGKEMNSVYRDIRTSVSFNTVMFLRYWKALLSIYIEKGRDKSCLPDLVALTEKYSKVIHAASYIEGEIDFESAIESYLDLITDVVLYYEAHPLPHNRKTKRTFLEMLCSCKNVQGEIARRRKERMIQVD